MSRTIVNTKGVRSKKYKLQLLDEEVIARRIVDHRRGLVTFVIEGGPAAPLFIPAEAMPTVRALLKEAFSDEWASKRKPDNGIDYEWHGDKVRAVVGQDGVVLRFGPWCSNTSDATFELAEILGREIQNREER